MADNGTRDGNKMDSPGYEDLDATDSATGKTRPVVVNAAKSRLGVRCFVASCSSILFVHMVFNVYLISVLRTLERRYSLTSKETGFILSVNDMVHMSVVVFVGYFGRKVCKPRVMATLNIFTIAGYLVFASPYFLFSDAAYQSPIHLTGNGTDDDDRAWDDRLCAATIMQERDACLEDESAMRQSNRAAYTVFMAAQILIGFGCSANIALGFSYIDELAPRSKSALYLGIASSMFSLGPIMGQLLGAMSTRLPENLIHSDLKPGDPGFIGCWWLGFVVCAILMTICCIPLFLFPARDVRRSEKPTRGDTRIVELARGFAEQVKEFPKSLLSLLKNVKFIVRTLSGICDIYLVTGVFINLPRYLEIHFHLAAYKANTYAAMPGFAGIIGGLTGGAIMSMLKLKTTGALRFMMFSTSVIACGLGVIMLLACPQENIAGHEDAATSRFSVVEQCNANCSCSTEKRDFSPVCSATDVTYFSPCHAGCTTFSNGTFGDCSCTEDGSVTAGYCHRGCWALAPYLTVTFIAFLVGSLDKVPTTFVMFRIVSEVDRSFAIALTSFALNLFSFIPGPVIFGTLIDSSCILWQRTCSTDTRGNCLLYDTASFRLLTYGVTLVFMFLSLGFICILYTIVRKENFDGNDCLEIGVNEPPEQEVRSTTKL